MLLCASAVRVRLRVPSLSFRVWFALKLDNTLKTVCWCFDRNLRAAGRSVLLLAYPPRSVVWLDAFAVASRSLCLEYRGYFTRQPVLRCYQNGCSLCQESPLAGWLFDSQQQHKRVLEPPNTTYMRVQQYCYECSYTRIRVRSSCRIIRTSYVEFFSTIDLYVVAPINRLPVGTYIFTAVRVIGAQERAEAGSTAPSCAARVVLLLLQSYVSFLRCASGVSCTYPQQAQPGCFCLVHDDAATVMYVRHFRRPGLESGVPIVPVLSREQRSARYHVMIISYVLLVRRRYIITEYEQYHRLLMMYPGLI